MDACVKAFAKFARKRGDEKHTNHGRNKIQRRNYNKNAYRNPERLHNNKFY